VAPRLTRVIPEIKQPDRALPAAIVMLFIVV
jgi:hypothetical protein